MRAVAAILLCSLALALAQSYTSSGLDENCQAVAFICGTSVNCRAPGNYCPYGYVCEYDTGSALTTSAKEAGKCTLQVAVSSPCNAKNVADNDFVCLDPKSTSNAVTCNVTGLNVGTCVYTGLFGPGEACGSSSAVGSPFDALGGCIASLCQSGKCETYPGKSSSFGCDRNCAPGSFCNSSSGNCETRLSAGATCESVSSSNYQCETTLVCTARNDPAAGKATCQTPFTQAFGATCSNNFDCQGGLICTSGICVNTASGSGEYCTGGTAQCPDGWLCSCHIDQGTDANGDNVYHSVQGSCSFNLAPTSSDQNAFTNLQNCLTNPASFGAVPGGETTCQDFWWHLQQGGASTAWNANTCFGFCVSKSGLNPKSAFRLGVDIPFINKVGECFSFLNSGSIALLPSLAILGFALLMAVVM